jgi:RNA polymerase sigma factor (sigma-70 family)
MSQTDLWHRFLLSDKNALSEIFLVYHDDLFRYGLRLSRGNENMVKDCIQDLFLKLWKNRNNLSEVKSIKPYLFKALRHHIFDSLDLQKSFNPIDYDADSICEVVYSHEDFLINDQVNEELRKKVINILNQLSPRQREAIYLRYFEELDFDSISQVMNMNVQSVRNTLGRGLQAMRELFVLEAFIVLLDKPHLFISLFS